MRGVVQSEVGFRDVRVRPEFVLGSGERGLEVGADSIGDVDQMLPGGREERDPLPRRDPPRS